MRVKYNSNSYRYTLHSGRRSLATLMDKHNYDLGLIQKILGHESEEMTLEYIDPDMDRITAAFKELWKTVKIPQRQTNTVKYSIYNL